MDFHWQAVERYHLLSNRETRENQGVGIGGSVTSRTGKLASFELAGRRFDDLIVEFAPGSAGSFSDAYTAGNIGAGVLRMFRIIFDFGNKRVAFVSLKTATFQDFPTLQD